jgi:hypothetical protein
MVPQIIIDYCSIQSFMVEGGIEGAWVEAWKGWCAMKALSRFMVMSEWNGSTGFSWGDGDVYVRLVQVPRLLGF